MHHMRRKSLRFKSLGHLRQLRRDISLIIEELEGEPRRDIDIAEEFDGSPRLLAEDIEDRPESASRNTTVRAQKIFCSDSHCDRCPHGPFLFEYPRGSKGKVRFRGIPFILLSQIDKAIARGEAEGLKNNLTPIYDELVARGKVEGPTKNNPT